MKKTSLVDWLRPAYVEPRAETIEARRAALSAYIADIERDQIPALIACFILNEACPEDLTSCLHAEDETFTESLTVEARLAAGAALRFLFEGNVPKKSNVAAHGLVAAAYGSRRDNTPYAEHIDAARVWLVENGRAVRRVGAVSVPSLDEADYSQQALQSLKARIEPGNTHSMFPLIDQLFSSMGEIQDALADVLSANRALLQRANVHGEETNLLWWIMGETSNELEVPLRNLAAGTAALMASWDFAKLTSMLPAHPSAHALLHRVLSTHGNPLEPSTSLAESVNGIPRDARERMTKEDAHQKLLPFTLAIRSSLMTKGELDWVPVFESASELDPLVRLAPFGVAEQFLLERLFVRAVGDQG